MGESRVCPAAGETSKKLIKDETARFAATLARSVGRLDWWNVYLEHTEYEWAMQRALYAVEPWGERRADIRQAHSTANHICAQGGFSNQDFRDIRRGIQNYLKVDEEPEEEVTGDTAAKLWGAM